MKKTVIKLNTNLYPSSSSLSLSLILVFIGLCPTTKSNAIITDRIIAIVNQDIVTKSELEREIQLVKNKLPNPPSDQELAQQLLNELILDKAQFQEAKNLRLAPTDEIVNRALSNMAKQNNVSLEQFQASLENQGVNFRHFKNQIAQEIAINQLKENLVAPKIRITEEEIQNHLAKEQQSLIEPEYKILHLVVNSSENDDATSDNNKRAEKLLEQAKKITTETDFVKFALQNTDEKEQVEWLWRAESQLPRLFAKGLKNTEIGQSTELLRSAKGFHLLFKIDERKISGRQILKQHVRHILIRTDALTENTEVAQKLKNIKNEILSGKTDFAHNAKQFSMDGSSSSGGDIGWIEPGETVPEFEKVMNGLQIGEISEPTKSQFGWHILQVLERKQESSSMEKQRLNAQQTLFPQKLARAWQDWLDQLKSRTFVKIIKIN